MSSSNRGRAPEDLEPHARSSTRPGATPARRSLRRKWNRLRRKASARLVAWFAPSVLGWLSRTWRVQVLDAENLESVCGNGRGHFMTLWHGRMVLGLPHHGGRDWCVLVSSSGDGDISKNLLEAFGYQVIRGSSSRGGAAALREMLAVLDRGGVLIITPDGPRGPRHSMNPGLAWMARATGYAVVPVGFGCEKAWRARSWDRFTIPKPWSRVAMVYGSPVQVARDARPEDLEAASEQIRINLIEAERRGFAALGAEPDW
jgi:lysophospholipid acyltransferase (LPLAT)-like uncharacterized protein